MGVWGPMMENYMEQWKMKWKLGVYRLPNPKCTFWVPIIRIIIFGVYNGVPIFRGPTI